MIEFIKMQGKINDIKIQGEFDDIKIQDAKVPLNENIIN